jgi:hypothetical protein
MRTQQRKDFAEARTRQRNDVEQDVTAARAAMMPVSATRRRR